LASEEGYNDTQLQQLIDIDFFNALFVIPRSIGFISHYLDQKRLDEGLFRLPDDAVSLS
jgi:ATP-citrate lyase alpha-subunit